MLDSYTHNSETKVVAVTKEIEKTISPDKVTEMYDRVKEEVEKNIVEAFVVESNELNGAAFAYHDDLDQMTLHVMTSFTLNHQKYTHKNIIPREKLLKHKMYQLLEGHFYNAVKNNIYRDSVPTLRNLLD